MKQMRPSSISRSASIVNRFSHIYYDVELTKFGIGCGQQFFLLQIAEMPGISLLSLAQEGYFDKGTTARAVKKLEELGYVRRKTDEKDKRITRLFATESAKPVIEAITETLKGWQRIMTEGLTKEETDTAEQIMEKIAENAYAYMKRKGRESSI